MKETTVAERPNVVVVLGRCRRHNALFGIRVEETTRGVWVCDWAFPVREQVASGEKFDRNEVAGTFSFAAGYPGCPSCGAGSLFRCGCGKVGCWDGEPRQVECPWCRCTGKLDGVVDRLTSGGDV